MDQFKRLIRWWILVPIGSKTTPQGALWLFDPPFGPENSFKKNCNDSGVRSGGGEN
jgi:hypothetical protein